MSGKHIALRKQVYFPEKFHEKMKHEAAVHKIGIAEWIQQKCSSSVTEKLEAFEKKILNQKKDIVSKGAALTIAKDRIRYLEKKISEAKK